MHIKFLLVFLLTRYFQNTSTKPSVVIVFVGEEPADPSIGFLPPNNITSGQGFVTFSVFVDDTASNLAQIDAEASIIFDANEPIETPPIFNTVCTLLFICAPSHIYSSATCYQYRDVS